MIGDQGPILPLLVVHLAAMYIVIPAVAGIDNVNGDFVWVPSNDSIVGSTIAVADALA